MNVHGTQAQDFDTAMRTRYAEATMQLSARTRTQLRDRLRAKLAGDVGKTLGHRPAWVLATACSLALALGFGMQWRSNEDLPTSAHAITVVSPQDKAESGELVAALDESPDLYLWLASDDAKSFASE